MGVQRKRVASHIADIRSPEGEMEEKIQEPQVPKSMDEIGKVLGPPETNVPFNVIRGGAGRARFFIIAFIVILFASAGALALGVYDETKNLAHFTELSFTQFRGGLSDLTLFKAGDAREKLAKVDQNAAPPFSNFGTSLIPFLKEGNELFVGIQHITANVVQVTDELSRLGKKFPDIITEGKGGELIASLEKIEGYLKSLDDRGAALGEAARAWGTFVPTGFDFLPIQVDLNRYRVFLGSLVTWLKDPSEHHIVLLLHNPSELRPAGGFLGSYADLVIYEGAIKGVEVHDINDADRTFTANIIPPKPLQVMTTRWKIADANWFFDFKESAAKVIEFMERASLYQEKGVTFDGAIAISPRVVSDLLELTGSLQVGRVTFTKDNFLTEVQKQVQAGQEKRSSYPKQVLKEVSSLLLEKLGKMDDSQKGKIVELVQTWISKKDAVVYFKNQDFQNFFDYYGATGSVYVSPQDFEGDYLALVDVNINGGKTDLFIREKVLLQSQLALEGTVNNRVNIIREHKGRDGRAGWYTQMNQNYTQLFVPKGSALTSFSGGFNKKIIPRIDYAKAGYALDEDVHTIESGTTDFFSYPGVQSFEEYGKTVFVTWSRMAVGETVNINFEYKHRLPFPLKSGATYQFVFDRQAGTTREYQFEIHAPLGFQWRENRLPIYEYISSDPPGRLVFTLTLEETP